MTDKQKQDVKQTARELYQARLISFETAAWAMKNAGYTRDETAEWFDRKALLNSANDLYISEADLIAPRTQIA
jgi:hypothetical protein